MTVMDVRRLVPASRVELYDVVNPEGEDLGQVQNFMVDPDTGRIAFVIVSFGGILGLSDKWIAMPMEVLRWDIEERRFLLDVPRHILEHARGLDKDKWPEEFDITWLDEIYTCFNCRPYWQSETVWKKEVQEETTSILMASVMKDFPVRGEDNRNAGHIREIIVDLKSGSAAYAVTDLTEMYGEHVVFPVPLACFTFYAGSAVLKLDKAHLEAATRLYEDRIILDNREILFIYTYFGVTPYWKDRTIWRRRGIPVHPTGMTGEYSPELVPVSSLIGDDICEMEATTSAGRVEDFMVDVSSGFIAGAVLSLPDSDLRYVAPMEVLSFDEPSRTLYLAVDRETVEQSPRFTAHELSVIRRENLSRVYNSYGYTPYWKEPQPVS